MHTAFSCCGTRACRVIRAKRLTSHQTNEGWYALRDVADGRHVAFGKVTGSDSFEIVTQPVLQKRHSYAFGSSLHGNRSCSQPISPKNIWFESVSNVQVDATLERPFTDQFDVRGCNVIDVKKAKCHRSLQVHIRSRAHRSCDSKIRCCLRFTDRDQVRKADVIQVPWRWRRLELCSYPVMVTENGAIEVDAGGNDTSMRAEFVPDVDHFKVKGVVSGCCEEAFEGTVVRIIDAHVVLLARQHGWPVLTSESGDLLGIDPTLKVERV